MDVQADLSLAGYTGLIVGFVVRWLIFFYKPSKMTCRFDFLIIIFISMGILRKQVKLVIPVKVG